MDIKYFTGIVDIDGLKFAYRNLAKQYHPDKGGSESVMKEINAEYDYILRTKNFKHRGNEKKEVNIDFEIKLRDIIEKVTVYADIDIEVCGTWLWFGGNTKEHKDKLKEIGCRFAPKKTKWYYRDESQKMNFKKKTLSMEEIREKYGSVYVGKKKAIN